MGDIDTSSIGLSGVAGVLPPRTRDLDELASLGLVTSSRATLEAFGFERVHVCDPRYAAMDMAVDAARAAMSDAGLQPHDIDVLIQATARPEGHVMSTAGSEDEVMRGFRYSSAWLQHALE